MMQKAFQRFTSLLLSLTMLLALASTAFAADTGADTSTDLASTDIEEVVSVNSTLSEEEIAKNLFESLSNEAQQIFLAQIAANPELTEYHRENVDPSFDPQAIPVAYANSEVDRVRSGLINLGFSTPVTYCFANVASELSAQVGANVEATSIEIYNLFFNLGLATTIASKWDEIDAGFSQIVGVFRDVFSDIRSAISDALWDTRDDAASLYYNSPVVAVGYYDATTTSLPGVRIRRGDGEEKRYICNVTAEDFQPRGNKFYIAALLRGSNRQMHLWICPEAIDYETALAIRYINYERVGILTDSPQLALLLAQQAAPGVQVGTKWHSNESHLGDPNYLPHYHPLNSANNTSKQIHLWHFSYR